MSKNVFDISQELMSNAYPGRGIILGRTPDNKKNVIAYFIMGRSENSRNRVFTETEDGIRTEAFDPSKMVDPSLIIYHPVRLYNGTLVVTNGDQTDTIVDYLKQGKSYFEALRTRQFEPDAPNYTSRISGVVNPDGSYSLSILKNFTSDRTANKRFFYEYDKPVAGLGHFIHTYQCDGDPLPPFRGEPKCIRIEQGYNNYEINESLLTNIVTENKNLPESAKHDMILALITLKYTQSNSVCYVKDGMTIGVGAGQQSRIHCTRLAGNKADNWFVRQHPKVLGLQFVDGIRRPDRDNAIDVYTSDEYEDVLAEGVWQKTFKVKPEVLTAEEKKAWIAKNTGVTVGSDAFFPFGDNVERARKSGVEYIVQPGGSIRDDNVIETANKYGITMAFTGMRLFHH